MPGERGIFDSHTIALNGHRHITAAHFVQRFVDEGVRWAHVDMAGKAWSDKAGTTYEKGATGYGVRLIDQYVADVIER